MGTPWKQWAVPLDEQRTAVCALLDQHGLAAKADAIVRACRVAAGFRLVTLASKSPPLGTSRAGGEPDLAASMAWPPLHSFLLQIDLTDVAALSLDLPLPKAGLLSFFVIDGDDEDGDYLSTGEVLFAAQAAARVKRPSKDVAVYPSRAIELAPLLTLPVPDGAAYEKLAFTEVQDTAYQDEVYPRFPRPSFQIGGCDQNRYERNDDPLLLALASQGAMKWHWGDDDSLHFYCPAEALRQAKFSEAYPSYVSG